MPNERWAVSGRPGLRSQADQEWAVTVVWGPGVVMQSSAWLTTGTHWCPNSSSCSRNSVSVLLLPCKLSFGILKDCYFFFFKHTFVKLSFLFVHIWWLSPASYSQVRGAVPPPSCPRSSGGTQVPSGPLSLVFSPRRTKSTAASSSSLECVSGTGTGASLTLLCWILTQAQCSQCDYHPHVTDEGIKA